MVTPAPERPHDELLNLLVEALVRELLDEEAAIQQVARSESKPADDGRARAAEILERLRERRTNGPR